MSSSSPRSIASLLGNEPDSLIERLVAQQSENDTLFHTLKANLPARQAEHLVAVSCRGNSLVLVADSPAWANLIRYQTAKILKLINADSEIFGKQVNQRIEKIVVRTAADAS